MLVIVYILHIQTPTFETPFKHFKTMQHWLPKMNAIPALNKFISKAVIKGHFPLTLKKVQFDTKHKDHTEIFYENDPNTVDKQKYYIHSKLQTAYTLQFLSKIPASPNPLSRPPLRPHKSPTHLPPLLQPLPACRKRACPQPLDPEPHQHTGS